MNKPGIIWKVFSLLFLFNTVGFSQFTSHSNARFISLSAGLFFLSQTYSQRQIMRALSDSCDVNAKFSPGKDTVVMNGNPVLFTNKSTNAASYSWFINGSYLSGGKDLMISPVVGVNEIMLVASNGIC